MFINNLYFLVIVFIGKAAEQMNVFRRIGKNQKVFGTQKFQRNFCCSSKARIPSLSFLVKPSKRETFLGLLKKLNFLLKLLLKGWRCWCNLASIEDCGFQSRNLLIRVQIPDTALSNNKLYKEFLTR